VPRVAVKGAREVATSVTVLVAVITARAARAAGRVDAGREAMAVEIPAETVLGTQMKRGRHRWLTLVTQPALRATKNEVIRATKGGAKGGRRGEVMGVANDGRNMNMGVTTRIGSENMQARGSSSSRRVQDRGCLVPA